MARLKRWACWLWMNGTLWGRGWSQRPRWYYGELGPPSGAPDLSQRPPTEFPFQARTVVLYGYWVVLGSLVALAILSAVLWAKQALQAPKKHAKLDPPPQEDCNDMVLRETLHLLDAVMEKTWQHIRRLERGRGKAPG